MMSAYGSWCIMHSLRLSKIADIVGALSLDAFNCRLEPFDELTQEIHPHPGQVQTAENIRNLLKGSAMRDLPKEQLQDPYSFRCIPQVHGACKQVIDQTRSTIKIEINSVSDNPNVFPEEDKILSGGNFHGEYMALGLDMLAIALAELGNIAERRMFQLLGGLRGLPVYLTSNAGLQSGLMTLQYTAASIVSQNKQLATPASVDSIVSSNGQEDHVSMGANSATKAYQVVLNLERVLALELMIAAQAMEMRKPTGTSKVLEALLVDYRKVVKPLNGDRVTDKDIANTIAFLRETPLPI